MKILLTGFNSRMLVSFAGCALGIAMEILFAFFGQKDCNGKPARSAGSGQARERPNLI